MNPRRQVWAAGKLMWVLAAVAFTVAAQSTNNPAPTDAPASAPTNAAMPAASVPAPTSPAVATQSPPAQVASAPPAVATRSRRSEARSSRPDDSAFGIIGERNIFNASRSGGQVRLSTRRAVVDSFTLVGTMAYEKGAFAFFNGSSSEFTKVLRANGVIAGYKVLDILADAVKLEADGKILELAVGAAMRREDQGTWHEGEAAAGSVTAPSDRSGGGNGEESQTSGATSSSTASANQSEILKRLMERREKESQ